MEKTTKKPIKNQIIPEQKRANDILSLFSKIQHYPYSLTYEQREKIEKKIINYYKKGDEKTKGMILFFINEKLSDVSRIREFVNSRTSNEPKPKILGSALNYYHSIEGQFFLLELLKRFEDELSLKMLTHFLSKYLAQPGRFFYAFAEKIIGLLGESKDVYALSFLLSLSELHSLDSSLHDSLFHSLSKWKKKLEKKSLIKDKTKIKELKKLRKKLDSIFSSKLNMNYFS